MDGQPVSKIPAPVSINPGDVATHLSYMRRDIDQSKINQEQNFNEIVKRMDKIDSKLDNLSGGYITRGEFADHLKADADHEQRIRSIEKRMWQWVGASSIISAALSYAVQFFT